MNHNGLRFTALGHLLGFEGVEETTDLQITTATVSLSAVDQALISSVLQYEYIDRTLEIWRCFFDEDEQLIPDPVKIFEGRMDEPVISDDPDSGTMTVSLSATSHFSDFERRPGRHTNHQEQQAHFLGDKFFEFVGSIDKDITWGR